MQKNNQTVGRLSSGFIGSICMVLGMAIIPAVFIYCVVKTVVWAGAWCPPLIVAYLALFLLPWSYYDKKAKLNASRFQMGDELFYAAYPDELDKAVKMERQKGIPEYRKAVLARIINEQSFKQKALPCPSGALQKGDLRTALYCLAGMGQLVIAVILAARGFEGVREYGLTGLDGTDLTPLFLALSSLSVLAVAISFFFRSKASLARASAGICLSLLIWASVISATNYKHYTSADLYLHLGLTLAWLLLALSVPAWAGDPLGEEKEAKRNTAIQIGLFELGLISEAQLQKRLLP